MSIQPLEASLITEILLDANIANDSEELQLDISEESAELEADVETSTDVVYNSDYNALYNKPSIEGVTLQHNKTFYDFGYSEMTNQDIENLLRT